MKQYLDPKPKNSAKPKEFHLKSAEQQSLINTILFILESFGIPVNPKNGYSRGLEKMALSFLALCDINKLDNLKNCKDASTVRALTTRQVIIWINSNFSESENISSGSYDDIRRKDLKHLVLAGIVLKSSPDSATNDSTRGYMVNPLYAELIRKFSKDDWLKIVAEQLKDVQKLSERLKREREINKVQVTLTDGKQLDFSVGEHNDLQKAIIEEFLPRYGFGAEVLYVGDTAKKYLHLDKERLKEINFFDIAHEELPDVIAYSEEKNWLYLIEAVHSSGPISEERLIQLQQLTEKCTADIVYVTAFQNRSKFRQFIADVAWETEVWISDNPDHLVHFNGDKFLGPYKPNKG